MLMLPSAPTDSTMPMCSSQTIRSPGCGWSLPAGIALPARWPQAHHVVDAAEALAGCRRSARRPRGRPRRRSRRTTGPGPGAPAVAWRNWRDARRVVRAGRLLGRRRPRRAHGGEHRLAGGSAARRDAVRPRWWRSRPGGRTRTRSARGGGRRGRHGLRRREHRLQLRDAGERGVQAHRDQAATAGVATSRSTEAHCSAATCALRCSVTYCLAASADAEAQRLVVHQLAHDLAHLTRGGGVEARDAVLDVGVDQRVGDQRQPHRARLEPAQVALAAVEAAVAGGGEGDVVQRHRSGVGVQGGERDGDAALLAELRREVVGEPLADADEVHVGRARA